MRLATVYTSTMILPRIPGQSCLLIPLALGAMGIAVAQTPGTLPAALSGDDVEEALPRYQIEIIAFAYHDFDPSEENFEQAPRGTLLDLLAPNLLETKEPDTPDPATLELEAIPDLSLAELEALAMESARSPAPIEAAEEISPDTDTLQTPEQPASSDQSVAEAEASQPGEGGDVGAEIADDMVEPEFFEDGLWYRILTDEQLQLADEVGRLELLDAYTPLVHGGWIQEGHPEEDAIPFDLSLLGIFNPRGSIRLHVSRFLHVRVDLSYESAAPAAPMTPRSRSFDGLTRIEFPPRYSLSVQRLTRSGELHFFDHPAFGVLVLVQPLPEEPETIEDELSPAA